MCFTLILNQITFTIKVKIFFVNKYNLFLIIYVENHNKLTLRDLKEIPITVIKYY